MPAQNGPDLERVLPADATGGWRMVVRDPWRVKFRDGRRRPVTVRVWRRGRTGRDIVQVEFSLNRESYGDSF